MSGVKKKILVLLIIAVAVGGIFYSRQNEQVSAEEKNEIKLSGNVDLREISLAFRQSDRISEIFVEEGDFVEKNQILAKIDSRDLNLQIQKIKSQIQTQEIFLQKLKNGNRPEEIAQYAAKIHAAEASLADSAQYLEKIQKVYMETDGGAITRNELTSAELNYQAKIAALDEVRQAYNLSVAGTRIEEIQEAEGNLKILQDELARQEFLLTQYDLISPSDGIIRSRLLEVGDMASPSTPIFKISLNEKKWVRVYVKETDLSKIFEGQAAEIFVDGLPNEILSGQVGFISSSAEFTPKTVQTDELRTSLLYEVRIFVEDKNNFLRMGMSATVVIKI